MKFKKGQKILIDIESNANKGNNQSKDTAILDELIETLKSIEKVDTSEIARLRPKNPFSKHNKVALSYNYGRIQLVTDLIKFINDSRNNK